jgi:hypothetical protein
MTYQKYYKSQISQEGGKIDYKTYYLNLLFKQGQVYPFFQVILIKEGMVNMFREGSLEICIIGYYLYSGLMPFLY